MLVSGMMMKGGRGGTYEELERLGELGGGVLGDHHFVGVVFLC